MLLALFDTVVLSGGLVHSMKSGEAPRVANVVFENDKIVAVGPDERGPADAKTIDVTGMHVLPGLIDGWVNHDPDHDRLYLGTGVTLVRDVGNDLLRILSECDRNARERSPGPWIWNGGAALDGNSPASLSSIVLGSADDAERKLARLFDVEKMVILPDYLVIQPGLGEAAWTKVLELAHLAQRQVWGALPNGIDLARAIAAGQDGLFHLEALRPAGVAWDKVDLEKLEPTLDLIAKSKLAITPTLAFWARLSLAPRKGFPELEALGPAYRKAWQAEYATRSSNNDQAWQAAVLAGVKVQQKILKRLHDKGTRLVPGSMAPNPWLVPGTALLDELSLWRQAGISGAETLRLVTAGAAETLGDARRGTIEKGKIADLVVTNLDPDTDLGTLARPAYVIVRGRVLDRGTLEGLRNELVVAQRILTEKQDQPIPVPELARPSGELLLEGLAETRALGVRLNAERYSIVRAFDGSLVYSSCVIIPGGASTPQTETTLLQAIDKNTVQTFDLTVKSGARVVEIHGVPVGNRMNISTTIDGVFQGIVSPTEKFAAIDAGGVVTEILLAHHQKEGQFKVLGFEGFSAAVFAWEMRLDRDPATSAANERHLFQCATGARQAIFESHGAPVQVRRETGNGVTTTTSSLVRSTERGLPLPAGRKSSELQIPFELLRVEPEPAKQPVPK